MRVCCHERDLAERVEQTARTDGVAFRRKVTRALAVRGFDDPLWLETREDDAGNAMAKRAIENESLARCGAWLASSSWLRKPEIIVIGESLTLTLEFSATAPTMSGFRVGLCYTNGAALRTSDGPGPTGRYHGAYTDAQLAGWGAHIAAWRGQGRDVYAYFDNDVGCAAPGDALRLRERAG